MDKNTLTGLLLMCAVIFGFMYCNRGNEEQAKKAETTEETATAQAPKADSLTTDDFSRMRAVLVKQAAADSAGTAKITDGGVTLSLNSDGKIEGSVASGDSVITLAMLQAHAVADVNANNEAVKQLRDITAHYGDPLAKYKTDSGQQNVVLQNDSLRIEIASKGAMITRAELLGYPDVKKDLVEVISPDENYYGFEINQISTRDLYFKAVEQTDNSVLMQIDIEGSKFGIRYSLDPDDHGSYMVKMELEQEGLDRVVGDNTTFAYFKWWHKLSRHESGKMFEDRNSAIYYKFAGDDGDIDHLSESSDDKEEPKGSLRWIAAKNQFFSAILISNEGFSGGANLESKAYEKGTADYEDYIKEYSIRSTVEYNAKSANPATFQFFLGPNKYRLLSSYDKYTPVEGEDLKLTRVIPLGWALFRWISTGIIIPVFSWLSSFISNYGLLILVLTILLKIVLAPLTIKSYMSQAKMKILAPDIKAINEKYPNPEDALKKQQKTMELYRQAGANPMGGCLPMLLQMPILIAMFMFFPSCIELRGQSFLWANDLSAPDKIVEWTGQIPFITNYFGNHISLFCLLMTITNIGYTYVTMQSQQGSSMPGMKWMMYLMPIFFLVFFNNYASGLSYYYFISLLLTIVQTYACRAFVKEDKVRAVMAENAKKPKKKSGFMARLEEAQRKQQAALREQQKRNGGGNNNRRR